jgi:predicted O-methyltransferase YrrM
MRITKNGYGIDYKYPSHFYANESGDSFSLHIPEWNELLAPYKDRPNLNFLELGTAHGRASVYLLESILTGDNCSLDTVDIVSERVEDGELISTYENLKPYIETNRCNFYIQTTVDFFLQNQNKKKYDVVYIDASHEKEDVLFDGINAYWLFTVNGVIIFDDYGWGECGHGIDAFLKVFHRKVNIIRTGWQVVIQKKEIPEHRPGYELEGVWA